VAAYTKLQQVLVIQAPHGLHRNTSHVRVISPAHWRFDCCLGTSFNIRPIVACAFRGVFIKPFHNNVLSKSVTVSKLSTEQQKFRDNA
jgi:hypothetical protein